MSGAFGRTPAGALSKDKDFGRGRKTEYSFEEESNSSLFGEMKMKCPKCQAENSETKKIEQCYIGNIVPIG